MAETLVPEVTVLLGENETLSQIVENQPNPKASNETFETSTTIANNTTKSVFSVERKAWPGTQPLTGGYEIPVGYYTAARFRGTLPAGVKCGFVYYDSREEEVLPTTRKFVCAFDSPSGKAYAESGPVGPVDWNVVEDRLGKSERTFDITDPILGARMEGGVHDNGNSWVKFWG